MMKLNKVSILIGLALTVSVTTANADLFGSLKDKLKGESKKYLLYHPIRSMRIAAQPGARVARTRAEQVRREMDIFAKFVLYLTI